MEAKESPSPKPLFPKPQTRSSDSQMESKYPHACLVQKKTFLGHVTKFFPLHQRETPLAGEQHHLAEQRCSLHFEIHTKDVATASVEVVFST